MKMMKKKKMKRKLRESGLRSGNDQPQIHLPVHAYSTVTLLKMAIIPPTSEEIVRLYTEGEEAAKAFVRQWEEEEEEEEEQEQEEEEETEAGQRR